MRQFSLRTLLLLVAATAVGSLLYVYFAPAPQIFETARKQEFQATSDLPKGSAYFFLDDQNEIVSILLIFGDHPLVISPHIDGGVYIESTRIAVPRDDSIYVISPSLELVRCDLNTKRFAKTSGDYSRWGKEIARIIKQNTW